ncbi:MAG: hypothetical protein IT495_17600 [Gammaproteobacteria bacterium]|nr:hypothetical protein [Gammaproteobacteria bacterium]
MKDGDPYFKVIVESGRVWIERIGPQHREYRHAGGPAILRKFDALDRMRKKSETGASLDGFAYFRQLDVARDYAIRNLELVQEALQLQFDRVRDYDGAGAPSELR